MRWLAHILVGEPVTTSPGYARVCTVGRAACMSVELMNRAAFTLGALLVWRFGTYMRLPGVDLAAWEMMYQALAGGMLRQMDALSGGAIHRLGILSLSLTPYVTSAILLQLLSMASHRLRRLADDEAGRR